MFRLVILISGLLFITGCRCVQPVFNQTDTVTVTETIRDTTFLIASDSAIIQAWFECDSLNKVIMKNMLIDNGNIITPFVQYRDNYLTITAQIDSQTVYHQWKERNVTETNTTIKVKNEPVIQKVKEPPWWCLLIMVIETFIILIWSFYIIKIYLDSKL